MDQRVLRVLEFDRVQKILGEFALSSLGRKMAEELMPSGRLEEVQKWQKETSEAEAILYFLGKNPMDEFSDVRNILRKSHIGSILSPKELLDIAHCLKTAWKVKEQIPKDTEKYEYVPQLSLSLHTFRSLEEEIARCILSEDEISDYASNELLHIRRQIRNMNNRIREKLNAMVHSQHYQKYLQEPIVTIRNDRFVIPVKQEHRGNVPGLIHDQSSSGATLFIEPMAIVEANNDLKQWMAKEKAEIERILKVFTIRVSEIADEIAANLQILAKLDLIFAKGRLSQEMKAVTPKLNNRGYSKIIRGRHPLIPADQVVPIDVWFGDDFNILVITGPNTGGKTVTLKTIGLFSLMAQSGLHVPADTGTELSVYEKIFADIGDEQSIEQSLSTFSSHMTNIVSILKNVTPKSLVLLDELGAGTDPTEGAALAMAILDRLLQKGVRVIATTHYSELKAFALTHAGLENASVEFNVETLRPTYRLLIGIPGKSNAFEISKRLGLEADVIARAREFLSNEEIRFEDVIRKAEYHRQITEKERKLAEEARREMQSLKEKLEAQNKHLEREKEKILRASREEAKRILLRAREEAEIIIKELKEKASKQAQEIHMMELQKSRQQLKSKIEDLDEKLYQNRTDIPKPFSKPPKDLRPGDGVMVMDLNQKGIALTKPDAKGELQVQIGILKVNAHISNLRKVDEVMVVSNQPRSKTVNMRDRQVGLEFDVRGKNLDEALLDIDKYLDDAFLSGFTEVSIIHGKGTGILRSGIHQHLRHHPHVLSFRLGKFGEGESGVTIVELK
ncbi:MAG: endonuclease MutS2 [Clostridia bacterium]|jgi:DNA mismatch repair protein MutS2